MIYSIWREALKMCLFFNSFSISCLSETVGINTKSLTGRSGLALHVVDSAYFCPLFPRPIKVLVLSPSQSIFPSVL